MLAPQPTSPPRMSALIVNLECFRFAILSLLLIATHQDGQVIWMDSRDEEGVSRSVGTSVVSGLGNNKANATTTPRIAPTTVPRNPCLGLLVYLLVHWNWSLCRSTTLTQSRHTVESVSMMTASVTGLTSETRMAAETRNNRFVLTVRNS
jgi:hypothetical protein